MHPNIAQPKCPIGLAELRERLGAIEQPTASSGAIRTGWDEIDAVFACGGLARGAVHEWIGLENQTTETRAPSSRRWSPPLNVLSHLARQCAAAAQREAMPLSVCWIGRRIWPTVQTLAAHEHDSTDLLARSLFVDAQDAAARMWAADLAARCSSVLVIADGSRFDIAATRRLQLAAEAGGWLVLLARPPGEDKELSAAATRWRIGRAVSPGDEPRYRLNLLRCKGLRSMHAQDRTFILEWASRDRLVLVPSEVRVRPHAAKIAG